MQLVGLPQDTRSVGWVSGGSATQVDPLKRRVIGTAFSSLPAASTCRDTPIAMQEVSVAQDTPPRFSDGDVDVWMGRVVQVVPDSCWAFDPPTPTHDVVEPQPRLMIEAAAVVAVTVQVEPFHRPRYARAGRAPALRPQRRAARRRRAGDGRWLRRGGTGEAQRHRRPRGAVPAQEARRGQHHPAGPVVGSDARRREAGRGRGAGEVEHPRAAAERDRCGPRRTVPHRRRDRRPAWATLRSRGRCRRGGSWWASCTTGRARSAPSQRGWRTAATRCRRSTTMPWSRGPACIPRRRRPGRWRRSCPRRRGAAARRRCRPHRCAGRSRRPTRGSRPRRGTRCHPALRPGPGSSGASSPSRLGGARSTR